MARVGKDTIRKLGSNDRLIGAINLADKHNLPCEYLCIGVAAGMCFAPDGDDSSKEVRAFANENGAMATLKKYCAYEGRMASLIAELYSMLKEGKQISALVKYCDELTGKAVRV